ncbi:MAG: DUF4111 domain-containing protein [Acetatifactor sp.]|nr:DUF4111 domain-containing protein [Acetatifactor sp.]
MTDLEASIKIMTGRIAGTLSSCDPSIYLYGSCTMDDFKQGWSDIDILVLTRVQIPDEQAMQLVTLRQSMLEEEPDNLYYRSFEGGMLTLDAFAGHTGDRVVYWGTSGQRITDTYDIGALCRTELLDSGILLHGKDIRDSLSRPAFPDMKENIQQHYEGIREYGGQTGRSFYSYGWLLDISRGIYTLRTGKIIAKTAAGEWALREGLCPDREALKMALQVRKNPAFYKKDETVFDYAEKLGDSIQRYADVLEAELHATYKMANVKKI